MDECNSRGLASEDHDGFSGELKTMVKLNPSAYEQEMTRTVSSQLVWP